MQTGLHALKKSFMILVNTLTRQSLPTAGFYETAQFITDNHAQLKMLDSDKSKLIETFADLICAIENKSLPNVKNIAFILNYDFEKQLESNTHNAFDCCLILFLIELHSHEKSPIPGAIIREEKNKSLTLVLSNSDFEKQPLYIDILKCAFSNRLLSRVEIMHSKISPNAFHMIFTTSALNSLLSSVKISHCNLDDAFTILLLSALIFNSKIRDIDLSHNKISKKSLEMIKECLQKKPELIHFNLEGNTDLGDWIIKVNILISHRIGILYSEGSVDEVIRLINNNRDQMQTFCHYLNLLQTFYLRSNNDAILNVSKYQSWLIEADKLIEEFENLQTTSVSSNNSLYQKLLDTTQSQVHALARHIKWESDDAQMKYHTVLIHMEKLKFIHRDVCRKLNPNELYQDLSLIQYTPEFLAEHLSIQRHLNKAIFDLKEILLNNPEANRLRQQLVLAATCLSYSIYCNYYSKKDRAIYDFYLTLSAQLTNLVESKALMKVKNLKSCFEYEMFSGLLLLASSVIIAGGKNDAVRNIALGLKCIDVIDNLLTHSTDKRFISNAAIALRTRFDYPVLERVLTRKDKIDVRNKVYQLFSRISSKFNFNDYPEVDRVDEAFTELSRLSYYMHLVKCEEQLSDFIEPYLIAEHNKLSKHSVTNPTMAEAVKALSQHPDKITKIHDYYISRLDDCNFERLPQFIVLDGGVLTRMDAYRLRFDWLQIMVSAPKLNQYLINTSTLIAENIQVYINKRFLNFDLKSLRENTQQVNFPAYVKNLEAKRYIESVLARICQLQIDMMRSSTPNNLVLPASVLHSCYSNDILTTLNNRIDNHTSSFKKLNDRIPAIYQQELSQIEEKKDLIAHLIAEEDKEKLSKKKIVVKRLPKKVTSSPPPKVNIKEKKQNSASIKTNGTESRIYNLLEKGEFQQALDASKSYVDSISEPISLTKVRGLAQLASCYHLVSTSHSDEFANSAKENYEQALSTIEIALCTLDYDGDKASYEEYLTLKYFIEQEAEHLPDESLQDIESIPHDLRNAEKAYMEFKLYNALEQYQSIISRKYLRQAHLGLARCKIAEHKYAEASSTLEIVLEKNPGDLDALLLKLKVLLNQQNYPDAASLYESINQHFPHYTKVKIAGLQLFHTLRDWKPLEDLLDNLLNERTQLIPSVLFSYALYRTKLGHWPLARSAFLRLIKLSPNKAKYLIYAAKLEQKLGNLEIALNYLEKALLCGDYHPEAYLVKAEIHLAKDDTTSALELCEKINEKTQGYFPAYQMIYSLLSGMDKSDELNIHFEKMRVIFSKHPKFILIALEHLKYPKEMIAEALQEFHYDEAIHLAVLSHYTSTRNKFAFMDLFTKIETRFSRSPNFVKLSNPMLNYFSPEKKANTLAQSIPVKSLSKPLTEPRIQKAEYATGMLLNAQIPVSIIEIINAFASYNIDCFCYGGGVYDVITGREPNDFDFVVCCDNPNIYFPILYKFFTQLSPSLHVPNLFRGFYNNIECDLTIKPANLDKRTFLQSLDSSANTFIIDSSHKVSDLLGVSHEVLINRESKLFQRNITNNGIMIFRWLRQSVIRNFILSPVDIEFVEKSKRHIQAIPSHQIFIELKKICASGYCQIILESWKRFGILLTIFPVLKSKNLDKTKSERLQNTIVELSGWMNQRNPAQGNAEVLFFISQIMTLLLPEIYPTLNTEEAITRMILDTPITKSFPEWNLMVLRSRITEQLLQKQSYTSCHQVLYPSEAAGVSIAAQFYPQPFSKATS